MAALSKRKPQGDYLRMTDRHQPEPRREARGKCINLAERSRLPNSGHSITESELIERLRVEEAGLSVADSSDGERTPEPGLSEDTLPIEREAARQSNRSKKGQKDVNPIPAYTSASVELKLQTAAKLYPKQVGKYRYVNEAMDLELVLYRKEILRRFQRSEMRNYQFPRQEPDTAPRHPPSCGKSKPITRSKKSEPLLRTGAATEATIEKEGTKHHHTSNSKTSIKLSKYVQ